MPFVPLQRKKNHIMAPKKKVSALIKLQIEAGKANPAPPLGPALGSHGVNIMDFCKAYNAKTQDKMGQIIPVEITVYEDRSFDFILKTPPAAALLKKAAGITKVAEALNGNGGIESVNMQLAQQYLKEFGNLAKTNNSMIVPADLANVAGILQACTSIIKKS